MSRKTARLGDDPRLEIHTGLDLTDADLTLQRLEAIPEVDDVTHIYFVGECYFVSLSSKVQNL